MKIVRIIEVCAPRVLQEKNVAYGAGGVLRVAMPVAALFNVCGVVKLNACSKIRCGGAGSVPRPLFTGEFFTGEFVGVKC
jgi:hypothetical protein